MTLPLTATYHINVMGDAAARMKSLRLTQSGREIRDGNDNMTQELLITTLSEPHTFEITSRDPERMKWLFDNFKQSYTTLNFIEVNPMNSSTNTWIKLEGCRFTAYDHASGWGDLQMSTLRGMCDTVTFDNTTAATITQIAMT